MSQFVNGVAQNTGIGNGILYRNSSTRITMIIDGTSNTVMVEEPPSLSHVLGIWAGAVSGGGANQGHSTRPHTWPR